MEEEWMMQIWILKPLQTTDEVERQGYGDYVDSVLEDGTAFIQIAKNMFVVNGWDPKARRSKRTWYHIQRSKIGVKSVYVCTCPASNADGIFCVHEYLLKEFGSELFPEDSVLPDCDEEIILFSRQIELTDLEFVNRFSCPSPNKRGLAGRVVVTYEGDDEGKGKWNCEKDSGPCLHVSSCSRKFHQLVHVDPDAEDVHGGQELYDQTGEWNHSSQTSEDLTWPQWTVPKVRKAKTAGSDKSVSYKPRPPPVWASLPGDAMIPAPFCATPPDRLELTEEASCCCSENRNYFRPLDTSSISEHAATIYGLSEALTTTVQLQSCYCKRRFIGPDCLSYGIFNYNNKTLFTHEILDEYTSAFTTSETPFSSWVLVISRRYAIRSSVFCSAEIFRSAWFAYAKLLALDGDMFCQKCGPSPATVIWDGVTLAFNRKHLLPSLEPQRYLRPRQQLLSDSLSRKLVRKVVSGPPLLFGNGVDGKTPSSRLDEEDEDEDEDDFDDGGKKSSKKNEPLSRLFNLHFGNASVVNMIPAPDVYKRFLFSAEESVLQMANSKALDALHEFIQQPTEANASALVDIPVLHDVLTYEFALISQPNQGLPKDVLAICQWILNKEQRCLAGLRKISACYMEVMVAAWKSRGWR
ncbi:hypothetical protein B0H13DRAFT_2285060 [Mycena leptocephala]|nr:hypothetical protein B0H13DRAFT_2285060 [Mycena leptocephala]